MSEDFPIAYDVPERRSVNWDAIENRMRVVLHEFKTELLKDLYERSIDPINTAIKEQEDFCLQHSQTLTEVKSFTDDIKNADLRNRTTKLETRLGIYQGILAAIGTAAIAQFAILIIMIVTHQIKL